MTTKISFLLKKKKKKALNHFDTKAFTLKEK